MSIPKVIHYCWFGGGKKSDLIEHCIDSWRKYCPDWDIVEWNETNFDPNFCAYTQKGISQQEICVRYRCGETGDNLRARWCLFRYGCRTVSIVEFFY